MKIQAAKELCALACVKVSTLRVLKGFKVLYNARNTNSVRSPTARLQSQKSTSDMLAEVCGSIFGVVVLPSLSFSSLTLLYKVGVPRITDAPFLVNYVDDVENILRRKIT